MEIREGAVAAITGGASGIGAALGAAFAAVGCRVELADVEAAALDAAAAAIDGDVNVTALDVGDAAAVEQWADRVYERRGRVDVLCNNAGVSTFNPVAAQTLDDWRWVLNVNLWGVIHGVHAFLPRMLAQGGPARIVNTSSLAGLASGLPGLGPYNVTKVGVVALSETLRAELGMAGSEVGVSVLCPGTTVTHILDAERNRPSELGREERDALGNALRDAVRAGFDTPAALSAAEVARMVLDAVRADRFWVVTSGEMHQLLSDRFAEIMSAVPGGGTSA